MGALGAGALGAAHARRGWEAPRKCDGLGRSAVRAASEKGGEGCRGARLLTRLVPRVRRCLVLSLV